MLAETHPLHFVFVENSTRSTGTVTHSPFTIGRLPASDIVLSSECVSRRHAEILYENEGYYILDVGSRHGTFVNGQRVTTRQKLQKGDSVRFGSLNGPLLQVCHEDHSSSTLYDLMGQMPESGATGSGLEKLRWFFESARKLTNLGTVDHILAALLETTLHLTQMERGFVFLRTASGDMKLALGRGSDGGEFASDETLSHGAIRQAVTTASEYIITDTANSESQTDSIIAQSIRSVLCIPLRKRRPDSVIGERDLLGLLYLDSRLKPGSLTQIDHDLLKAIATDASALIDNAQLVLAEESERRYREELNIAAAIQHGLMSAKVPVLSYADISARSVPCREVGGDFFDIVADEDSVSVVVADVSGKGISAAILASTLQGMIYSQLIAGQPLSNIADVVNRYVCSKGIRKYATLVILRLKRNGEMQYINCGHVYPFLCSAGDSFRLTASNLPVGLIESASFESATTHLTSGTRVIVVTDGVTEAEDSSGEFFGEENLAASLAQCASLEEIYNLVQSFSGHDTAGDDITMLEVRYTG